MAQDDGEKMQRRNLTFPDTLVSEIEATRIKLGLASHSEVLRGAFRLYKHILDNGGAVYVRDTDGIETKIISP